MSKPINPDIAIPSEFAADGQKRNFTEEKIQHGFNSVAKDTLEGDCLNKFIDDTYKGLNYAIDGVEDLYDVTDDLKDLSNLSASGQAILDNKANKDLSNLSATGEAHFANPDLSNLSTSGNNRLHALKGYLDNGTALTDAEGLADVVNYAHSTFDLSKFTVTGTPTITSDGIASGFDANNYVNIPNIDVATYNTWKVYVPIKLTDLSATGFFSIGGSGVKTGVNYNNSASTQKLKFDVYTSSSTTVQIPMSNQSLIADTEYIIAVGYNGSAFTFELLDEYYQLINSTSADSAVNIYSGSDIRIGLRRSDSLFTGGISDLKKVKIIGDGAEVFNGNKTGIDTYTIGGNTVTIPYTLSKTGSKIAGANSRTDVTAVYNQQGYAPYYTLDEANGNFTLPQGEIYGMMLNQSVPHIIETYQNGTSGYVVYSNGYCEQWGRGVTDNDGWCAINLLKEYQDTNYIPIANQCHGTYETPSMVYADIVSTDDMRTTAFRALCSTNADTPAINAGIAWITRGYINL